MIIQCPTCGTQAKIPDSKEGAKVRCSDCDRVYLARARGRKSTRSQGSMLPIGIGAGVVVLAVVAFTLSKGGKKPEPEPPPPVEKVVTKRETDTTGWESPLVKHVRKIHDMAFARDENALQNELAMDLVWARIESEGGDPVDAAGYGLLDGSVKLPFVSTVLEGLTSEDPKNLIAQWFPFDGQVLEETDDGAWIRLTLQSRDTSQQTTRHIDWKLRDTQFGRKAWSWERWISPEELAADRRGKSVSRAKKTLSDGSIVYEAEIEKVDWMPETSEADRKYISSLIDTMLDLESREWIPAQDEIKILGKPTIPGLLNRFADLAEAGWDDLDRASQGQRLHITLTEITEYRTTFNPHEALGGTDERRESGIKQWFFWYRRHFKRFEGTPEQTDLLEEEWVPKTDAEKREYEKYKRKIEAEEKEAARRAGDG